MLADAQQKRIVSLESQLKVSQEGLAKSRAEQTRNAAVIEGKNTEVQALQQRLAELDRLKTIADEADTLRQQLAEANDLVSRFMAQQQQQQQEQQIEEEDGETAVEETFDHNQQAPRGDMLSSDTVAEQRQRREFRTSRL